MASVLDQVIVISQVEAHTIAIAKLESDMSQVLSRLSIIEDWIHSHKQQKTTDNEDTSVSRDYQISPLIEQCRCIYTRLSTLKNSSNERHTTKTVAVASTADITQHFDAAIQAFRLQLMNVKQDTIKLNEKSLQTYRHIGLQRQRQVQVISGSNNTVKKEQQFELKSFEATLNSSITAHKKFEQLKLIVNNHGDKIRDYEQYKAFVDTLAGDSVSSGKFCQLQTVVNTLAYEQETLLSTVKSTEQQRAEISEMCLKLEHLETQSRQLQTFIENSSRVSDPTVQCPLESQVIAKTRMQELDLHRQEIRARITTELETLRETLADVMISTMIARSTPRAMTMHFGRNISVLQLINNERCVDILSVSTSSELLVGCEGWNPLCIYDADGKHVLTVDRPGFLLNATWTPRGNIMCKMGNNLGRYTNILTIRRSGDVVVETDMKDAQRFSVSADNIIYLACGTLGVYKSTDDGVTWSHVFNCSGNFYAVQAVKVFSDANVDIFYVIGQDHSKNWRLRELKLTKDFFKNPTWRDVASFHFAAISMAFDGRTQVIISQSETNRLHMFSLAERSQGERILDLSEYLKDDDDYIHRIAVDGHRNELYMGLMKPGKVKVIKL